MHAILEQKGIKVDSIFKECFFPSQKIVKGSTPFYDKNSYSALKKWTNTIHMIIWSTTHILHTCQRIISCHSPSFSSNFPFVISNSCNQFFTWWKAKASAGVKRKRRCHLNYGHNTDGMTEQVTLGISRFTLQYSSQEARNMDAVLDQLFHAVVHRLSNCLMTNIGAKK